MLISMVNSTIRSVWRAARRRNSDGRGDNLNEQYNVCTVSLLREVIGDCLALEDQYEAKDFLYLGYEVVRLQRQLEASSSANHRCTISSNSKLRFRPNVLYFIIL